MRHIISAIKNLTLILLLQLPFNLFAQDFKPSTDLKLQSADFKVEEDEEWSLLFKRTKGWFGADGIFSIPVDGVDSIGAAKNNKTFFVFSDTLVGEVIDGKPKGTTMPHNTVAYLDGMEPLPDHIKFYWDTNDKGKPSSIFDPKTPNTQPGEYLWLGDGFVNPDLKNTTYVFGLRVKNVKEGMGFKQTGTILIALPKGSKPPFKDQRQMDTPLYFDQPDGRHGVFGSAILNNTKSAKVPNPDGYVYVYGVAGRQHNAVVARVKPKSFEDFSQWRYWDGKGWGTDLTQSAAIADRTSPEMSVTPLPDGRYVMVFQIDVVGKSVCMRLGSSPYGPFGPIIKLYNTDRFDQNLLTYNAKAHPSLSKPGELLITYNVNFTDFFNQLNATPDIYRPRFIKVVFAKK